MDNETLAMRWHETAEPVCQLKVEKPLIEIRKYQQEGVQFFLRKKRAMNTDRPGLGKTIQAALAAESPTLVLCPKYLVGQWELWIQTHLPEQSVIALKGDRFKKAKIIKDQQADFIVGNYQVLRTHYQELMARQKALPWKTLILDESHHLRNRQAIMSQHAAKLANAPGMERVYELTATPIWKEVDDLWMQLHILQPQIFSSYFHFVDTYCISESDRFGTKVLGVKKSMVPQLTQMLGILQLGRDYKQAGRELPPIINKEVKIDMPPKIKKLYEDTKNYWVEEIEEGFTNFSQVLHSLRQISSGPHKTDAIVEALEDLQNKPVLIFCWYRDHAHELSRHIPGSKVITGEMKEDERRHVARTNPGTTIATISSLCEGVDLSHLRHVFFAEEHWPPGSTDQALSRVHRERQTESNEEPVLIYYFHSKGTIDEHIHNVATRRAGEAANLREVMQEAGLL